MNFSIHIFKKIIAINKEDSLQESIKKQKMNLLLNLLFNPKIYHNVVYKLYNVLLNHSHIQPDNQIELQYFDK
jgi:hypothetical protein